MAVQEVLPSTGQSAGGEQWQGKVTFPDWKGYTDDTLAMNHMYSFFGYHGQGSLRICPAGEVTGFSLYVNDVLVNTAELAGGRQYDLDISSLTRDGTNTIQISGITPRDLKNAVTVCAPYPEILPGTPEDSGLSAQALEMLSDLISTDISGQLLDLSADMALDSLKLIPEDLNGKARQAGTHPAVRNAQSKYELFEKMAGRCEDQTMITSLRNSLRTAFGQAQIALP